MWALATLAEWVVASVLATVALCSLFRLFGWEQQSDIQTGSRRKGVISPRQATEEIAVEEAVCEADREW